MDYGRRAYLCAGSIGQLVGGLWVGADCSAVEMPEAITIRPLWGGVPESEELRERLISIIPGGNILVHRANQDSAVALKVMAHVYGDNFIVLQPSGFLAMEDLGLGRICLHQPDSSIAALHFRDEGEDPECGRRDGFVDFNGPMGAYEIAQLAGDAEHFAFMERRSFGVVEVNDGESEPDEVSLPGDQVDESADSLAVGGEVLAITDGEAPDRETDDYPGENRSTDSSLDARFDRMWRDTRSPCFRRFRDYAMPIDDLEGEEWPMSGLARTTWCVRFHLEADPSRPWGRPTSWQILWTRPGHYCDDCIALNHADLCRSLGVACCFHNECSVQSQKCQLICDEIRRLEEAKGDDPTSLRSAWFGFNFVSRLPRARKFCMCRALGAWSQIEADRSADVSSAGLPDAKTGGSDD